jgi:hypothetical protein
MKEEREIMTNSSNAIVETIHALPISEVYPFLKTRLQSLTQEEADLRLRQVGRNATLIALWIHDRNSPPGYKRKQ